MKKTGCLPWLAVGMIAMLLSLSIGRYGVSFPEALRILWNGAFGVDASGQAEKVVMNIRLPRVLLAYAAGMALSAAGCTYQAVFRNVLASPDVLGASSGAGFGAAVAILLGFSRLGVTLTAFMVSLAGIVLVALISRAVPGERTLSILLAGIVMSALFTAGTSCVKIVADPMNELPAITFWLMGSFAGVRLSDVGAAVVPLLAGMVPLALVRWRLNLLTQDEDEAAAMGVRVRMLRGVAVLCASVLTAQCVASAGMIGWVGLVVPHVCRKLTGDDLKKLLPVSMFCGGLFLLLADDLARCLLVTEIPIGILTAAIGAPVFVFIMAKGKTVR